MAYCGEDWLKNMGLSVSASSIIARVRVSLLLTKFNSRPVEYAAVTRSRQNEYA